MFINDYPDDRSSDRLALDGTPQVRVHREHAEVRWRVDMQGSLSARGAAPPGSRRVDRFWLLRPPRTGQAMNQPGELRVANDSSGRRRQATMPSMRKMWAAFT